jgi:hypothetical protein
MLCGVVCLLACVVVHLDVSICPHWLLGSNKDLLQIVKVMTSSNMQRAKPDLEKRLVFIESLVFGVALLVCWFAC